MVKLHCCSVKWHILCELKAIVLCFIYATSSPPAHHILFVFCSVKRELSGGCVCTRCQNPAQLQCLIFTYDA